MPPRPERHEGELIPRIIAPYPRQEAFALRPEGLLLSVERKQHTYYISIFWFVNAFSLFFQKKVKSFFFSLKFLDSTPQGEYIEPVKLRS